MNDNVLLLFIIYIPFSLQIECLYQQVYISFEQYIK